VVCACGIGRHFALRFHLRGGELGVVGAATFGVDPATLSAAKVKGSDKRTSKNSVRHAAREDS
jgi:hypothetical protein